MDEFGYNYGYRWIDEVDEVGEVGDAMRCDGML